MKESKEKMECTEKQVPEKQRYGYGIRHVQAGLMLVCITVIFMARSCMAVAVLAMTDISRINDTSVEIYNWDKKTQGVILSSFFWGYVAMQIPSGMLAKRFGGKPILFFALLSSGLINILVPSMASLGGWPMVCALRAAMGLSQACTFPASHTLLGRWLPPSERTALSGAVYGGIQLGTIIAMPVSGLLSDTAAGWKLIFYGMGVLCLVSAGLWYTLTASSPAEHKMIAPAEVDYIESELNTVGVTILPPTPWKHILRSGPLLSIIVVHIGVGQFFILFFVEIPTYLEKGLGIPLKSSALLSALPYIGMWIGSTICTVVCERIYNRRLLSLVNCRKLFNSLCLFGAAAGLVGLSLVGPQNVYIAIAILIGAMTMSGAGLAGFMVSKIKPLRVGRSGRQWRRTMFSSGRPMAERMMMKVNHLDLSPTFGGVLLSLTNFVSNVVTLGVPIFTGFVLRNDATDVGRWHIVFLTSAAICVITNVFYLIFGSAERQPWDDAQFNDKQEALPEEIAVLKEKEENN